MERISRNICTPSMRMRVKQAFKQIVMRWRIFGCGEPGREAAHKQFGDSSISGRGTVLRVEFCLKNVYTCYRTILAILIIVVYLSSSSDCRDYEARKICEMPVLYSTRRTALIGPKHDQGAISSGVELMLPCALRKNSQIASVLAPESDADATEVCSVPAVERIAVSANVRNELRLAEFQRGFSEARAALGACSTAVAPVVLPTATGEHADETTAFVCVVLLTTAWAYYRTNAVENAARERSSLLKRVPGLDNFIAL
eukprot:IDg11161t1